ncbi:hypothetical protein J2T61_001972 [Methanocalculus sp. AMF5]|uniref:hypothetical protein n=1 Tax=Methanocalculus sp. AMF5 TaxID=1198257 RepID=UPI00209D8C1A|nr:hypothetical protein [Methanocalculus sp. AMF5]MCP1663265.1 hypothetical protein [Methanocalculus sp. AMF5]
MKWHKTQDIQHRGSLAKEVWICRSETTTEEFTIDLYLGKKTNLLELENNIVSEINRQLDFHSLTRREIFDSNPEEMEYVSHCLVINVSTDYTSPVLNIYGAEYVMEPITGHVYLKKTPSKKKITNFYSRDATYAKTYTSIQNAEKRLDTVSTPLINWLMTIYSKQYGKTPQKILDVGAGGAFC